MNIVVETSKYLKILALEIFWLYGTSHMTHTIIFTLRHIAKGCVESVLHLILRA